jgi:glycerol-3-phosphate dehydrogenase
MKLADVGAIEQKPGDYDLAIIGGGINGCGIARDAAGRGLKVLLVEQDDLASATSSWSSKLIHGGLRYLEQFEFRLVREALQEREVLLRIAPHLIRPLEFVLPHDAHMRPAWMVRTGLWLYDHLGGASSLPGSRGLRFPDPVYAAGLKPRIARGFVYTDARVDDARLVLGNAAAARELGADIRVRTRLIGGRRLDGGWQLDLLDVDSGARSRIRARGLVNAAGPWVKQLLDEVLSIDIAARVKLVKGSHIVVPRVHPHAHALILQNSDKRVVFIIPFEGAYSLVGTTDVGIDNLDNSGEISSGEVDYLLAAVNRCLERPLAGADIVWRYAGVRPLYDDGAANPAEVTRDYVLELDQRDRRAPLLSIFGGKITTYRRLAEHALAELAPFYPQMGPAWTGRKALPGGDIDASLLPRLGQRYPQLPTDYLQALAARHGSRVVAVLDGVNSIEDLGRQFGRGATRLVEREIDYCIRQEWVRRPDDMLWRRSKCGLHLDASGRAMAADFIALRVRAILA